MTAMVRDEPNVCNGWKADTIRLTVAAMNRAMKRFLALAGVSWLALWGYVGWRGYTLTHDAHSYIGELPPGATVPEPVLTALEAGQAYSLQAVIWGAAAPLFLLLLGWVATPMLRRRSNVRS